jgi:glutamate dehydrogenase
MSNLTPVPSSLLKAAHQQNDSSTSINKVKNEAGYTTPVFKGKDEQKAFVEREVAAKVRC